MTPEQESEILDVFARGRDMTVATLRADGWPQATTVSYANHGLALYFGCYTGSQKAANIARSERVSATIVLPYGNWNEIRAVSLAGRARKVDNDDELQKVFGLLLSKFPAIRYFISEGAAHNIEIVRIEPTVVSLLDYRKGFGHTEEIAVVSTPGGAPANGAAEQPVRKASAGARQAQALLGS